MPTTRSVYGAAGVPRASRRSPQAHRQRRREGGEKASGRIAEDDEKATSLGDALERLRNIVGPVVPGESPAMLGDALRCIAGVAGSLYQDGNRYRYATQPTVTQLAEDRVEQLKREPDTIPL